MIKLFVIVACFTNSAELSRTQCMKIYRETEKTVEAKFDVDLKLKKTVYRHHTFDPSFENQYGTVTEIDSFFHERDFEKYDLHLAVVSKPQPAYISSGVFYGNQVCTNGTAMITANKSQFDSYLSSYVSHLEHEIYHLLGGIHKTGQNFDSSLVNQVGDCLTRWRKA
jgi:uncharacterized GH25 family protein